MNLYVLKRDKEPERHCWARVLFGDVSYYLYKATPEEIAGHNAPWQPIKEEVSL